MHLFAIPEWFIWSSFIGVFAATLWKGSPQARWMAGAELAQMIYQRIWYCVGDLCYGGLLDERAWQYYLQDLILVGIGVGCVLTGRRYWTVGVASIALCGLANDFFMTTERLHVSIWAARWASYIWTYATLLLVLSDVWSNIRDERVARRIGQAGTASA